MFRYDQKEGGLKPPHALARLTIPRRAVAADRVRVFNRITASSTDERLSDRRAILHDDAPVQRQEIIACLSSAPASFSVGPTARGRK